MSRITLNQLRADNHLYAYGAQDLDSYDLGKVNDLLTRIESTRNDRPQSLDKIIYTDEYGDYYPDALYEEDPYHDGLPCIVQNASAHVELCSDGTLGFSTSGGVYVRKEKEDISKLKYIGKANRSFWTWSTAGPGAHRGIYFQAEVSLFEYNERAEESKHLTGEFRYSIYVTECEEPYDSDYKYIAVGAGRAWKTKEALNESLSIYDAIEEPIPNNPESRIYWLKTVPLR